jgi:hypothetical protein
MTQTVWQLEGNSARLRLPRSQASFDLDNSSRGMVDWRVNGSSLGALSVFALNLPHRLPPEPRAVEAYLRGDDLIVTYGEVPYRPFETQLYFRAHLPLASDTLAAIELIVAVRTSRWDVCPQLEVRSEILASEASQLVDCQAGNFASVLPKPDGSQVQDETGLPTCYLLRLPAAKYSYVEMAHPSDAGASDWNGWLQGPDFRLRLAHQLFAPQLEKGVILKARLMAAVVDRAGDKAAAVALYRQFVAEALPLTT